MIDTAPLAAVLKAAVKDRAVDYGKVEAHAKDLAAFIDKVAGADVSKDSEDDQLAFFINAYNAIVLQAFLAHKKTRVVDVAGFFDKEKHGVAKEQLTLNELEEKRVRLLGKDGVSRDPRVHFAVNCASRDCPPLAPVPYAGKTLRKDLDERARAYLTRPGEVKVDELGHRVVVVQIFEWYASDFGGERGARKFIADYVKDPRVVDESWDLDFRPYDWTPNST